MNSSAQKIEYNFRATKVQVTDDQLIVLLEDGREIRTPIEYFPKLARADMKTRKNLRIMGPGVGIEWPDLDEHLSVEGIVLGRPVVDW